MKIGFFSERYPPQREGISVSIHIFQEELEKLGHEVYVFTSSDSIKHKTEGKNRIIRYPAVKGLLADDYPVTFFIPPREVKKIEALNLDIIHCHMPSPIGLMGVYVALKNDIPLVSTYHADLVEYAKYYKNLLPGSMLLSIFSPFLFGRHFEDFKSAAYALRPKRSIVSWHQNLVMTMMNLFHNYCSIVIAPSKKMEQKLISMGTRSDIRVISTGVKPLLATKHEIYNYRKLLKIKDEAQVVLYVGRLNKEKNLQLLIESFQVALISCPNTVLVIAGSNTYENELKAHVEKLGIEQNVIFAGYIERAKLGRVYGIADIFAFASLSDTQAVVINEAALSKLPIVACEENLNAVLKHGYSSLIALPNPDSFGSSMVDLLRHNKKRTEMGENAYKLAKKFSPRAQALKMETLYKELLKK